MTARKEVARIEATTVTRQGTTAASPRRAILDALSAYELAVAERLKAEQEAATDRHQADRLVGLAEQNAHRELERVQAAAQEVAATEAARVRALSEQAAETEAAAIRLLETSALAHVRGIGDGWQLEPRTSTDEQAAAAFTAVQKADVDLRAALLRLASQRLDDHDWNSARDILIAFMDATAGPLRERAEKLLYRSYLEQAAAASASLNWHAADYLIESALQIFPDALRTDPALTSQFLLATKRLIEAAVAADRHDEAGQRLAAARERLGPEHPDLKGIPGNRVLDWTSRAAICLQEFGGHSQPVEDMAFTPDGEHLVSVDGNQIKTWQLPGTNQARLISTIVAPGAYWLAGNGQLAVTADGAILRTGDGSVVAQLAAYPDQKVTALASSGDGSAIAWVAREATPSLRLALRGEQGFQPYNPHGRDVDQRDIRLLAPFAIQSAIPSRISEDAVTAGAAKTSSLDYKTRYRSATVRLAKSILTADSWTGQARASFAVEPDALIVSVALSASAAFVAALHPQGQAVITDIGTGIIRYVFPALPWQMPSDTITVSPQDRLVAIAQAQRSTQWQSTVTAWDIATGGKARSWSVPDIVLDICVSPDERLVAAITANGSITISDVLTTSQLVIGIHPESVSPADRRIRFSPDGSRLATSGGPTIRIWSTP